MGSKIVLALLAVVLAAGLAYGAFGVYQLHSLQATGAYPTQAGFDLDELHGRDYATIGDYLYFASFGGHMYRVNLQTFSRELYLQMPIWGIITNDENLFFVTANDDVPGLLSYDPATSQMHFITNRIDANAGIRYYNGTIFFVDGARRIRSILPCGRPVSTHSPTNVATFDVQLPLLIFTQHGCDLQQEYNMNNSEINFP